MPLLVLRVHEMSTQHETGSASLETQAAGSTPLEVALSIKAGSVWVNGHNLFDAAAGFVGYRGSRFVRDGDKEVRHGH